jgi:hypothetical protein
MYGRIQGRGYHTTECKTLLDLKFCLFVCFALLGFELRALYLLGRCCTVFSGYFGDRVLLFFSELAWNHNPLISVFHIAWDDRLEPLVPRLNLNFISVTS